MNSFGQIFKIHTFGESHGPAMGVVIDGCPAGLEWQEDILRNNLQKRRPGQSEIVSGRNESDDFEILSGVFQAKTLGTPIAIVVKNRDAQSQDYIDKNGLQKFSNRVGHADDLWFEKFGHADFRGGGRASGRETLSRVIAGSVAEMLVKQLSPETSVKSYVHAIADFTVDDNKSTPLEKQEPVVNFLMKAKEQGKSYGGIAAIEVEAPPKYLGEPVFKKIKSELTAAYMSVGASCGVELGAGFKSTMAEGSEFHNRNQQEVYGGIRGGMSTGENILFKIAFKPTSSVNDVAKKGRHDPCIVPRAVPVLEAMTYLVLADLLLLRRLNRIQTAPFNCG
ncbi:MAG: chorismate synthase [Bdellovibrionales bacterium]|nr:chorismate synthase [Bdellovibrionales bacterium]